MCQVDITHISGTATSLLDGVMMIMFQQSCCWQQSNYEEETWQGQKTADWNTPQIPSHNPCSQSATIASALCISTLSCVIQSLQISKKVQPGQSGKMELESRLPSVCWIYSSPFQRSHISILKERTDLLERSYWKKSLASSFSYVCRRYCFVIWIC